MNGLATLRSKKITICIIIQSLAQLDAIYGHEERKIIADNCTYKAVLGAIDDDTQGYFSKLVGTHEVEQISIQKESNLFYDEVKRHSVSKAGKRFIRPEEFAYLQDIVLLTPYGPHGVQKRLYYAAG